MVLSLGLIGCGTAGGSGGTRTDATGTNMSDSSGFVYDPSEDVIGTSDDEYVLTDSEQQLTALVENVADTVVEITTSQVTTGSWMQQYVTEFYPLVPPVLFPFSISTINLKGDLVITVSSSDIGNGTCRRVVSLLKQYGVHAYISDSYLYSTLKYKPEL